MIHVFTEYKKKPNQTNQQDELQQDKRNLIKNCNPLQACFI